jgi:histidinol-phosphatase (PHP family)
MTAAFIDSAIKQDFEEICFTDHMPLSISNARDRIPKGNVKQYCEAVKEKAIEYKGKISIKTGIEIDYHPGFYSEIENVLEQGNFDIIIGATHMHLLGHNIKMNSMTPNEYAKLSLQNTLLSIKSGYFDVIPHIDLYRWVYTQSERFPIKPGTYCVDEHMDIIKEVMREIETRKLKLEVNSHAILHKVDECGVYPGESIMKLANQYNLQYVFGSDAHTPDWVGYGYDYLKNSSIYKKAFV